SAAAAMAGCAGCAARGRSRGRGTCARMRFRRGYVSEHPGTTSLTTATRESPMSIGKLALLAMTLFGLAIGVHEGIRLAGGLAVIILAQILLFAAAMAMLVSVARQD